MKNNKFCIFVHFLYWRVKSVLENYPKIRLSSGTKGKMWLSSGRKGKKWLGWDAWYTKYLFKGICEITSCNSDMVFAISSRHQAIKFLMWIFLIRKNSIRSLIILAHLEFLYTLMLLRASRYQEQPLLGFYLRTWSENKKIHIKRCKIFDIR